MSQLRSLCASDWRPSSGWRCRVEAKMVPVGWAKLGRKWPVGSSWFFSTQLMFISPHLVGILGNLFGVGKHKRNSPPNTCLHPGWGLFERTSCQGNPFWFPCSESELSGMLAVQWDIWYVRTWQEPWDIVDLHIGTGSNLNSFQHLWAIFYGISTTDLQCAQMHALLVVN